MRSSLSTETLARCCPSKTHHPDLGRRTVIGFVLIATQLGLATTVEGNITNNPDLKIAQEFIEDCIHPTHAEETAFFTSDTLTVNIAMTYWRPLPDERTLPIHFFGATFR